MTRRCRAAPARWSEHNFSRILCTLCQSASVIICQPTLCACFPQCSRLLRYRRNLRRSDHDPGCARNISSPPYASTAWRYVPAFSCVYCAGTDDARPSCSLCPRSSSLSPHTAGRLRPGADAGLAAECHATRATSWLSQKQGDCSSRRWCCSCRRRWRWQRRGRCARRSSASTGWGRSRSGRGSFLVCAIAAFAGIAQAAAG